MSALEWDLVNSKQSSETSGSRLAELQTALAQANFAEVLFSNDAKQALASVPRLLDNLTQSTPSPASSSSQPAQLSADDQTLLLLVAVALQHAFLQVNWTGPDLSFGPADVIAEILGQTAPTNDDERKSADATVNAAALPLLTLLGEPAYHLTAQPALLLLSIRILAFLATQQQPLTTLPWWRLRSHLVHLALLDESVALDEKVVEAVIALIVHVPDADTAAALNLEIGLYQHKLGQDKAANQAFLAAARASGLEFELTGALGKRTKYQIASHSQLVLLAESRKRDDDEAESSGATLSDKLPEALALNDDVLLEQTEFTKVTTSSAGESKLSHIDPANQPALHPLDQSLILALCLAQGNNSPAHGLTTQQMQPFVERVITHPRNWSVHSTALLLRARLESNRARTVERSALQLAALIEQMPSADSAPAERLKYVHQLPLPPKWSLERELAQRYLSLGVVRSALEIFTRLEMWEDAVECLRRMEREKEAVRIVRDLLEGRKIESDLVTSLSRASLTEVRREKISSVQAGKLWCLLGDLALSSDEAHDPIVARQTAIEYYTKAWEVSGHSSSRAMRSLGSIYVSERRYDDAVPALKHALGINPLYEQVWFTLGVCYMQLREWSNARDAFKRQVAIDDEEGEGWNNLAAVYLRLGEEGLEEGQTPPPVSYENKLLAFRALKSGVRTSYNNWRMWQNYMIVSVDVGELAEAVRAMTRVVEELGGNNPDAVDPDVLDKLVDAVTRDDYNGGQGPADGKPPKTSNEGWGLYPMVVRLFDTTIMPRVSDSPRVWRSHARLLRWTEDWAGAIEDYIRAYRASVVTDERVERDRTRWREAVEEVEDLVASLEMLGPRVPKVEGKKGGDWRFQARGIVRTFMGRTRDSFEGEPEWERLKDLLDGLKRSD